MYMHVHRLKRIYSHQRWHSGQRFINYAAERVNIRSRIQGLPLALFGAHIERTAKNLAWLREILGGNAVSGQNLSNAEIDDFDYLFALVFDQEKIARFE